MGVALGRALERSCWGVPAELRLRGARCPSAGPPPPLRTRVPAGPGRARSPHPPGSLSPSPLVHGFVHLRGTRRDNRVQRKVKRPQRSLARPQCREQDKIQVRRPTGQAANPTQLTVSVTPLAPSSQPPPAAPPRPRGGWRAGAAAGPGPVPCQPPHAPVPPLLREKVLL